MENHYCLVTNTDLDTAEKILKIGAILIKITLENPTCLRPPEKGRVQVPTDIIATISYFSCVTLISCLYKKDESYI